MNSIQSPQILTDLYRDLRDRRLLPLVLVLVVGIAVVPIALSSKAEPAPPSVPAAEIPVKKRAKAPATKVVVAKPGVRDYRERLPGDPENPFIQKFTGPDPAAVAAAGLSGASSADPLGGAAPVGGTTTTTPDTGSTTPVAPPSGEPTITRTETTRYYGYRVKLRAGKVGEELKVYESVGNFAEVPGKQVPALVFLGVAKSSSAKARSAVFLVSNGVSSVDGEGDCTYSGDQCQLLSLKPGQHADLIWLDGVAYRVQLVKYNVVVRNKLPGLGTDGEPNPRALSYAQG